MSWPLEKIGSKCLPVESWNPAKDGAETSFQYIDIGSIDQDQKRVTSTTMVTGATAPSRARQLVRGHDVLVSTVRPNLNSVAKLTPVAQATTASTGFCVLRSDSKVLDSSYLFAWVRSSMFVNSLMKKIAGANYPAVSQSDVRNEEIPLPPLDDQKRIAHLLGKVEGLIARRKQHLQQLDALLKSVFLEMFGPRNSAYHDWPEVEIRSLASDNRGAMRTGPFGSNLLHSEFTENGDVAVLGIDNAVQNRFAWGEPRFITTEKYRELETYRIFPGDVIVTIMGTIGRSAVVPKDVPLAINTKHLAAITLNLQKANPVFLSYSIHSSPYILNQFKSKNRGAIMSGLNLGLIKETKLRHPPIQLQNRFAEIHQRVDEVKDSILQSLTDLEALYGALSQKAFAGVLDLSRVTIPHLDEEIPLQQTAPEPRPNPTPQFNLPKIPEGINLADKSQRASQIKMWLDAYIDSLYSGQELSASKFVSMASNALRLAEGIDPWGQPDQDQIKDLIFDALTSGRLTQTSAAEAGRSPLRKIVLHKAGPKIDR
ncbi:MAG: restriction endonuclease subunit S [Fibrobacterota bacterium]|nr:MAG: restriction endonuclease subunit S [Fibrobacterota bacterium]